MEEGFSKKHVEQIITRMRRAASREGPRYTTILHGPRKKLDLTIHEYVLADTIRVLSSERSKFPGWCYGSKKYLGESMGLSERSIFSLITRAKEKGVVEGHPKHAFLLRTTKIWFDTVEVARLSPPQSRPLSTSSQIASSR